MDTLDLSVLIAIALALIAYFSKGSLWGKEDDNSVHGVAGGFQTRDLVEILNSTNKKALVLYGSQTGTSEDYAHKYARELQSKFSIPTLCGDLSEFDFDNLNDIPEQVEGFTFITFFMATYGEGEPTDNAVEFIEFLKNDAEDLSNLKYTVFGLGNSTYEFYNQMGKTTNKRFSELGAQLVGTFGEGDDGQATMDEDFLAWKDSLFDTIKKDLHLEEHEVVYQPGLKVKENTALTTSSPNVSVGEPNKAYVLREDENLLQYGPFDHTHPYIAPISSSRELCSETSERNCIHLEFDLSNTNLRYSTGDHLAVWPSNANEHVESFLKVFNLTDKRSSVFDIEFLDPTVTVHFPFPTTYEAVVRHHLEISGPISRQTLKQFIPYAPDQSTKQEVIRLSESKDVFHNEVTAKYYNLADLLFKVSKETPWNVPFNFLIETMPNLQHRYYSISSSSLSEKQTIHITAMIEAFTPTGSDHIVTGVTTNLLWNIQLNQDKSTVKAPVSYDLNGPRNLFSPYKLPVHIRRSTFKLPSNPALPVIMIGPGTGVAPFRGFIRERCQQVDNGTPNIGQSILYYGCRNSEQDFLYRDEWPTYSKKLGDKFKMYTAFSRENSHKVYVQHRLLENSREFIELMDQGAFIYVCGDAGKMAKDVNKAIVEILIKEKGLSEEDATESIREFKTSNRYQEDVW
ncbi:NADP-cytochrome P450 reductase [Komagataella phaffii CBS 7435]|uniref:NADPH--cytochrome P450 reductase n=2 Tax=Komagataella phaffii TaxID=460519 RepID=C4R901_KOMPG|nr:NADP-cytochrome P450 reductase [Komagataella phaffii GS115]AOA64386.1 GQ67_05198T0 [Komagataella phaffii]CAH2450515.1 NADP-cytochrome P450 reductase [Komagataella phaffii CBS 7435]AOA69907.1 GQ68_05180T0 [Komagataella phaffii GS115]CAY72076.1 NADP-cytochrome P450 reductase [Komagataella phaffii GS115]CCA40319.1 NADP-cytochrome P450 reductase [Komagataella phaffii CBS 7435]